MRTEGAPEERVRRLVLAAMIGAGAAVPASAQQSALASTVESPLEHARLHSQDPRPRLHNTEAWIVLESRELANDLAGLFEEGTDLEHAYKLEENSARGIEALGWRTGEGGKTVHYDAEPMSRLWLGLWRGVLGALIPEHLL